MAKRTGNPPGRPLEDDGRALAFMAWLIVTGKERKIRPAARAAVSKAEQGVRPESIVDRLRTNYAKNREKLEDAARAAIAKESATEETEQPKSSSARRQAPVPDLGNALPRHRVEELTDAMRTARKEAKDAALQSLPLDPRRIEEARALAKSARDQLKYMESTSVSSKEDVEEIIRQIVDKYRR